MYFIKYFISLLLISSILFGDSSNIKNSDIPNIVSLNWLKSNIDNSNLVIIDLRAKKEYEKDHIQNAVNIPGLKSLFDDKFFMPKLDFLKNLFSEAGIDNNSLVLAYDNGDFIWAARFYWILETLGHKKVGILKVGYNDLLK